jgi:K+-sensing histidine kinase KdpD
MGSLTLHKGQNADVVTGADTKSDDNHLTSTSMINCPTILTGMSHEVRTHMNAIVAFSFLMNRNGCNESEREEFSKQILSSCEQLIGLFDNFIDSAIIETGNSKADLKICRLSNILDDLLSEFREILKKEGQNDLVLIAENSTTDSTEIFIDTNRVFRIIRNLFQNALKNTKTGYIKIGYYFRDDKVTFYVLDSGQGYFKCKEFLHTEDLNESLSIFNDTSSAINMALAKKLIQLLSGTIWIECNGLTGSGIYFSIPVKVADSSEITINKYVNSMIAI